MKRVIETNEGIQAEATVHDFDLFQRGFRDRGMLETDSIIRSGISSGHAVEIGPGPGYLGLEWLKTTDRTTLSGIEISPAMIKTAEKNRADYGLFERAEYREGNALAIPLEDGFADHVFTNGSLHEWENPYLVLSEAHRILKPGGRLFISDLKRNINPLLAAMMKITVKGKAMKAGFSTSLQAAYTVDEMERLMEWSAFTAYRVSSNPFGLQITAIK